MKLIKGLTKDQITKIIKKVAANHKNKIFGCYAPNDIEQEAWIIAMERLHQFNQEKVKNVSLEQSLENWLNRVVSSRLKNLYRNKHRVPNKNINLVYNTSVMDISVLTDKFLFEDDNKDILLKLLTELQPEHIDVLESLLSGEKINTYYKNKLFDRICEICPTIIKR